RSVASDRHEQPIGLVFAERRCAAGLEESDDLEGCWADANRAADRIFRAEEILRDRGTDHADLRLEQLVVLRPELALVDREFADWKIREGDAVETGGDVLVAVDDLPDRREKWRHAGDAHGFVRDRFRVVFRETARAFVAH